MGKTIEVKSRAGGGTRKAQPTREAREAPTSAGARIVAAFEEAIDLMRTGGPPETLFTVRTYRVDFTPHAFGPDDVRRVRDLLGMSQTVFARFLGMDPNTIRSWEQGNRTPSAIARRFMEEVEADPEHWRRRNALRAVVTETSGPVA